MEPAPSRLARVSTPDPAARGANACRASARLPAFPDPAAEPGRASSPGRRWRVPGVFGLLAVAGAGVPPAPAEQPRPRLVAVLPSERQVMEVHFSPDGRTLAASAGDRLVLWETASRQVRARLRSAPHGLLEFVFAPDGKGLAGVSESSVWRWTLPEGEVERTRVPGPDLRHLAYSPDGETIAFSDVKGCVHFLHAAADRDGATWSRERYITSLAYSPDGQTLAAAVSRDPIGALPCVQLWDAAGSRFRDRLRIIDGVTAGRVAFSPDGRCLAACGGNDDTVRVWDLARGRLRSSWQTRMGAVAALAYSPDGRALVGAGGPQDGVFTDPSPGEVRVWDAATGKELVAFPAHDRSIDWMSLSPDGRLLAVSCGTMDFTRAVNLWDVSAFTGLSPGEPRPPAGGVPAPPAKGEPSPARPGAPSAEEAVARWADLAGHDAERAYRALAALARSPARATALAEKCLRPAEPADPREVARRIRDLDGDDFSSREAAEQELRTLGELAGPALGQALQANPAPEVRRRIAGLLARLDGPASGGRLQALRAVELLEHVGTAEARRVLERLAQGAPEAALTREARMSLRRMERRASKPKAP